MSAYKWVPYNCSPHVPPNAVVAGHDCDGSEIYIGKSRFKNDELPCKIIPKRRQAYVAFNSQEHEVKNCEIMVESKLSWQHCDGIRIPPTAVPGGRTATGETLYIGRAHHSGSLSVGKVHPSHRCLYIPFGGKEVPVKSFEILVAN
ncbi:Protein of unknown function (DUF3421) [Popillia japonica]|uniref:Uncharacterized protein n=1 Tax=Popillia japonica TaxID=7064 RepID=A0AAW1N1G2_POPJA